MSEENLDLFRTLFLRAVDHVGASYMNTVYGDMEILLQYVEQEAQRRNLQQHMIGDSLIKSGERIFCYELYHQLRLAMLPHEQQFAGVLLQGELRKYQVMPLLQRMGLEALSGNFIPDFLLHTPGNAEDHACVIEVKTDRFLRYEYLAADISKLVEFIMRYGYQRGIFLSINIPFEQLRQLVSDCQLIRRIEHIENVAGQIDIVGRENDQTPAAFFNLAEIFAT